MSGEHVYKQIEVTGSSEESSDDAIRRAISRACETLDHVHWFEVLETRGLIENGDVRYWQVTIKIGFRMDG